MTNFEKIKAMTIEEMAVAICEHFNSGEKRWENCNLCPGAEQCRWYANGAEAWLEKVVE